MIDKCCSSWLQPVIYTAKKNSLDDWEYLQQSYIFVHLEAITYLLLQKELPTYTPLKSSLLLEMAIYSDKSNSDNVRN